jgi:hypothetical protein
MDFADDTSAWLEVVACRTLACNPCFLRNELHVSHMPLKLLRQAGRNHADCIHRVNETWIKCSARLHHGCSAVFSQRLEPTAPIDTHLFGWTHFQIRVLRMKIVGKLLVIFLYIYVYIYIYHGRIHHMKYKAHKTSTPTSDRTRYSNSNENVCFET